MLIQSKTAFEESLPLRAGADRAGARKARTMAVEGRADPVWRAWALGVCIVFSGLVWAALIAAL
jgi:hypothetical protein